MVKGALEPEIDETLPLKEQYRYFSYLRSCLLIFKNVDGASTKEFKRKGWSFSGLI